MMHVYRVFVRTGRPADDPKREVAVVVLAQSRADAGRIGALEVISMGYSAEIVDVVNVWDQVPQAIAHTWLWAE